MAVTTLEALVAELREVCARLPDRRKGPGDDVGVVHMWTAPYLQDVCSALIRSLASICPACGALAYERWPSSATEVPNKIATS
jgi:hypothetical protein